MEDHEIVERGTWLHLTDIVGFTLKAWAILEIFIFRQQAIQPVWSQSETKFDELAR